MKRIVLVWVLLFASAPLFAWTIGPMNYQGRLLDAAGIPVGYPTPTTANFVVNIWDAPTGGNLKYSEQQNNITVNDGTYSFLVSTGVTTAGSWDIYLWNTPTLYLEIVVNGQTLTPRHLLAAAPFAFQANLALTTNNALALGGKSSGAVLQDICKAGKGKWLELVSQCLGVGASFPGPSMVNLNTLTASTDLSNLDLTNADISGINFGAADFTGTLFKGTTLNASGVKDANMTKTIWDSVISTGTATFTANFTSATIGNMSLAGWNMAGTTLNNMSAADLTACPINLPSQYVCVLIRGTSLYAIYGPNLNLSKDSLMSKYLLVVQDFTALNLSGVSFAGDKLKSLNIQNANLDGASFKDTFILNPFVNNTSFTNATDISDAVIQGGSFNGSSGSHMVIHDSKLEAVSVLGDSIWIDYTVLNQVDFDLFGTAASLYLGYATINTLLIEDASSVRMEGTRTSGGAYLGDGVNGVVLVQAKFFDGNISGNWRNSVVDHSDGAWFINVSFNGIDLTGANWTDAYNEGSLLFRNVNWYGAKCPDGFQVTTLGDTCIGHGI